MSDNDEDDIVRRLSNIRERKRAAEDSEDEDDSDEEEDAPINLQEAHYNQARGSFLTHWGSSQASSVTTPSLPYWQASPSAMSVPRVVPTITNPSPPTFAPGGIMSRPLPPATTVLAPSIAPFSWAPSPVVAAAPSRSASPAVAGLLPTKGKKPPLSRRNRSKSPPTTAVRNPEEEKKLQQEIDMVVNNFHPDYRHRIECEQERDVKNLEDQELHLVAKWLNVNKPTPHKLDLAAFNSKQIRKLAQNCGVKGGGNLTLFKARKMIAMSITMGTVYSDHSIGNPKTTSTERRCNTFMRIINVCFHSDMRDRFIDLNDAKKRADYERAHGGNPVKEFWVQVSEMVNDGSLNDVLGNVLEAREGEDDRLREFVADGEFNLNDYTIQTFQSCQQNMSDCMKARENCLKAMRQSGHHSNDLWTYATTTKFTKLRKSSPPVPAKAVYYCHVICTKHPDIDGKFAPFLSERLKSDSEIDLTGNAGERSDDGNSNKRKSGVDKMVDTITTATTRIASVIEAKQSATDKDEAKLWEEYMKVAEKFLDWKDDSSKRPLLRNLAIRVTKLERQCGIPADQSITCGVVEIPSEVFTDSLATASDITNNK